MYIYNKRVTMKTIKCTRCKLERDISEFYKSKRHELGYIPTCKECESIRKSSVYKPDVRQKKYEDNKEKYLLSVKKYAEKNKDKIRQQRKDYYLNNKIKFLEAGWKKKGILNKDLEFFKKKDFDELFGKAGMVCQICEESVVKHKKGFVVDHCHTTGIARGILCAHCNVALGSFKDNIEIIKNAVKYLDMQNTNVVKMAIS